MKQSRTWKFILGWWQCVRRGWWIPSVWGAQRVLVHKSRRGSKSYNSIWDMFLFLVQNVVLACLKSFFHFRTIKLILAYILYLIEATACRYSRELAFSPPSWCTSSPIRSFGFLNFKTNFIPWEVLSYMLCDMAVAKQMGTNKLQGCTTFSVCNNSLNFSLNFLVQALTPVLNRAMRYYKERRIWWANLVRQVMRLDFSWDAAPVDQYIRLYDEAVTSGGLTAGRWRRNLNWDPVFTEGVD